MPPKAKNAVGACNTYDIKEIKVQIHCSTKKREGDSPPGLRALIPDSALDEAFNPLWSMLPKEQGRSFFKQLGSSIGNTELFTLLGASYIRFLNRKVV